MDIAEVDGRYGHVRYMSLKQAQWMKDFIVKHDISQIMELGFFHGKSSAFMAAVLQDLGRGHITTFDLEIAHDRKPPITEILDDLKLSSFVTPVYAHRSFTWELSRLLEQKPVPQFDMCYIDGAHTWDGTGFSFFLVDLMLKPGGWVIFDDLDWTIAKSEGKSGVKSAAYADYGDDEREAMQVRKVFEVLVPARGYINRSEVKAFRWGIAQKPVTRA